MVAMSESKPRLLSITEAAEALGVSAATLRRWADAGQVETVRLPSGYRRFDARAIERLRQEMGIKD